MRFSYRYYGKREKSDYYLWYIGILVAFLYFFSDWFSKATGYIVDEDPDNYLAKCLTDKGSVLYVSKSCPDCEIQKNLFGSSAIRYVNYTDCSVGESSCRELAGLPAWKLNGSVYYGVKTLTDLRGLTGCVR